MSEVVTATSAPRDSFARPLVLTLLGALLTVAAVALSLSDTTASIVTTWWRSETFAHGFLVLPVFAWLLWRDREALIRLPAGPDIRLLPAIAASGLLWLLSRVAGVLVGEQIALVLMIALIVGSFVGREVARRIRFPLLFLLFMAPVGEELVPILMRVTADLTVGAVVLTGIPVYREGMYFSLPSGDWSVVEACSGIRYLIASIMLGSLYAMLSYTSTTRRLLFIALSAVVPIVANGVRAFLIVMIGHVSDMRLASGVDHLVYGWLFFGIVMFVLFSLGSLFREADVTERDATGQASSHARPRQASVPRGERSARVRSLAAHAAMVVACVMVWPAWAAAIDGAPADAAVARAQLERLLPGETRPMPSTPTDTLGDWQPRIGGHDASLSRRFAPASERAGVLALAYLYVSQRQGKEMISSENVLVSSKDSDWRLAERTVVAPLAAGSGPTLEIEQSRLRSNGQTLLVWRWYRVGDTHTGSATRAKLLEARDKLLLRHAPSVLYLIAVDAADPHAVDALRDVATRIVTESTPA